MVQNTSPRSKYVYDAIIELKKGNKIMDEVTPLVEALRNSETDYRQQVDRFVTGSSGANPNELIRSLSNRVNAGLTLTALMNERHNRVLMYWKGTLLQWRGR